MAGTPSFIGIDLGTTYSAVAAITAHGKAEIIPSDASRPVMPSMILFPEEATEPPVVGERARQLARFEAGRVAKHVKRQMGAPRWRFELDSERRFDAEELSAILLRELQGFAERHLSKTITQAVITVPAYFDDGERHATRRAGELAGLDVLGILNEPVAAALAYGLDHALERGRALVYDLGGGTFDVTIVEVEGGHIRVVATDGVRRLGGMDWDARLTEAVCQDFLKRHNVDPRDELFSSRRLYDEVESSKRSLSAHKRAKLFLEAGSTGDSVTISRQRFESLTEGLLLQTEAYTEAVLEKAGVTWVDIDRILLAGGSTRMPMVRKMLKRLSGMEPDSSLNPDECVALGAAYAAAKLANKSDSTTLSGPLEQLVANIEIENVASHSIGILTVIDDIRQNLVMIREQSPLPSEVTKTFATRSARQVTVEVKVLEGDGIDPQDCRLLGTVVVKGLPKDRPRGSRVSVTYRCDEEGLLTVRALDLASGQQVEATIERPEQNEAERDFEARRRRLASLYAQADLTSPAALDLSDQHDPVALPTPPEGPDAPSIEPKLERPDLRAPSTRLAAPSQATEQPPTEGSAAPLASSGPPASSPAPEAPSVLLTDGPGAQKLRSADDPWSLAVAQGYLGAETEADFWSDPMTQSAEPRGANTQAPADDPERAHSTGPMGASVDVE